MRARWAEGSHQEVAWAQGASRRPRARGGEKAECGGLGRAGDGLAHQLTKGGLAPRAEASRRRTAERPKGWGWPEWQGLLWSQ